MRYIIYSRMDQLYDLRRQFINSCYFDMSTPTSSICLPAYYVFFDEHSGLADLITAAIIHIKIPKNLLYD